MFNWNIDFGQLIITVMLAIIAFFMKRQMDIFDLRLDKHDELFLKVIKDI